MACNSTEAAEELSNTSEITVFQHPFNQARYTPRQIGGNPNNKYVTIIDGTTDARFFIINASWENIIAMENYVGKGDIPQSTSMSLEGELEIVEPLGASFLNRLTDICDDLETDPVGLIFVLKTIFVGHNDDGSTEMISNIRPLLFINYDITALFDSSGAKYKMNFVGAVNGLGKLPHTQKIFNGVSINVVQGETLAKTFERLALRVNDSYKEYEQQAIEDYANTLYEEAKKTGNAISEDSAAQQAKQFYQNNYRPVTYEIIAPDYDKSEYQAASNEPIRVGGRGSDTPYNFGSDLGVEEIIKKLMASCEGVIKDGTEGDSGKRYIYKIASGLKSAHDKFVVQYYVNRYELIEQPFDAASKGEEYKPRPGQSIDFNYIFTGKNVDIKSFDIKMEMGMAFFQIAATTDTVPDQKTKLTADINRMTHQSGQSPANKANNTRPKTPLFLGSIIKQPMARNTKNPVSSATFQALLSRHAALENIEAKMTIFGNPQLLGELLILPSELAAGKTEDAKENKTINPEWLKTPTLCKVNIKMPVDANDFNTEYEDFWYKGYYMIFGVKQMFSDGEFLQELDLMSIPVSDKTTSNTKPRDKNIPTKEAIKEPTTTSSTTVGHRGTRTYDKTNEERTVGEVKNRTYGRNGRKG